MLINNKRGISPLVATILLIAFAVSIGALIMNWSSSDSSTGILKAPSCSVIDITVLSSCFTEDSIRISIINKGPADSNGIILRNSDGGRDYLIADSNLKVNSNKVLTIYKTDFNSDSFYVIPIVQTGQDELVCTSQKIDVSNLVEC
jgi:flagellin-like protein